MKLRSNSIFAFQVNINHLNIYLFQAGENLTEVFDKDFDKEYKPNDSMTKSSIFSQQNDNFPSVKFY